MRQRTITAIFFAAAMLGGFLGGKWTFLLLFSVITIGSLWELMTIYYKDDLEARLPRRLIGTTVGSLPFLIIVWEIYSQYLGTNTAPEIVTQATFDVSKTTFSILTIALYGIFMVELFLKGQKPFDNIGKYFTGFFYVGLPMAGAVTIAFSKGKYDALAVLLPILLIWTNDTMAYIIGSKIGKTPLFPRISPKKTWEGTIGGAICTILISFGLSYYLDTYTRLEWLTIGTIVAIIGTIGDLIESMLKRSYEIKDSGNFLPGHGGFLDRFDSYIFALPFIWLALHLLR